MSKIIKSAMLLAAVCLLNACASTKQNETQVSNNLDFDTVETSENAQKLSTLQKSCDNNTNSLKTTARQVCASYQRDDASWSSLSPLSAMVSDGNTLNQLSEEISSNETYDNQSTYVVIFLKNDEYKALKVKEQSLTSYNDYFTKDQIGHSWRIRDTWNSCN